MPKILIYYEHKAREYQYCHALKYELKRRGYSVGLCQILNRHTWWHKIFSMPKVVVVGTVSTAVSVANFNLLEDRCDFLRGRTPLIVNLQAEQCFRDEDCNYNIVADDEWRQSIYYLCWGERRKKQILERGVEEEKICVSGAMHLDFLRDEFHGIYKDREEIAHLYHLDSKKRWILIMSSFVMATMTSAQLHILTKMQQACDPEYMHEQVVAKQKVSTISQSILLDWIDNYLSQNSDCIFIYRPHPKEKITEDIKRMIESYPNQFLFIGEESIQQWILVCDTIDNWISTAIVEAFFAKKQAIVVQPMPVQKDFEPAVLDECKKIRTYDAFKMAQAGDQLFHEETFPVNKKIMNSYYKTEGPCAYIQAADFIEKVYHLPAPAVGKSKFTWRTVFSKWFLFRIYRSVYAVTRLKFSWIALRFKNTFRKLEVEVDKGYISGDVLVTKEDRKTCRKIKRYVYQIAGRNLRDIENETETAKQGESVCQ